MGQFNGLRFGVAAVASVIAVIAIYRSKQGSRVISENILQTQRKKKIKFVGPGIIIKLVNYEFKPYSKEKLIEGHHGEIGAVGTFEGITRDNFEGKHVTELEYEAYEDMAMKVLTSIAQDALNKFEGLAKVVIIHRLGICPVTETSLFVGTISPHRAPALQAIPYLVDELKTKVPIWKLEKYSNEGSNAEWKENAGWNPRALAS